MAPTVVPSDRLRAALLERQLLDRRSTMEPLAAIERLAGLQTQHAPVGYVSLWSRLRDFDRPWLTHALEERQAIQGTMMRSTIHTVTAADYWPMTIGVRRLRRAWLERTWRRDLVRVDIEGLAHAARAALADGPLRFPELLGRLTAAGYPEAAARWVGHFVDLIRVPPSGTWERRKADLYGLAEAWLPVADPEPTEAQGIELLVRRALGAYGPLTAAELAGWMGLPVGTVRQVLGRLDLRPLRGEDGADLVDLPEASLPPPGPPGPPRFLGQWDPVLLVHFRRTQVLPEAFRSRLLVLNTTHWPSPFLLGGQVAGSWRSSGGRIEVTPFRALTAAEHHELDDEAERLAAFYAP